MVHAQEPTCTDLRIRSTQDTHKIFYAIQKGNLKMVTRRLDADERLALRSGCVYAWEERGPHSEITGLGIERFTEGRRWTPSRVRDEFLFYYERYMPPPDATGSGSPADVKPPRDWEPLVKQTYSVWVDTDNGRRKWHITAYFTQGTIDQLRCVDDIPGVGDLVVPEGHFKSTRVGKRAKTDEAKGESSKSALSRTFAAFPTPYSSSSPTVESSPVLMYPPYRDLSSEVQQNSYYQIPSPSDGDRSQTRPSSYPHQDRSSASLSPPLPSSRMQYGGQTPSYAPVAQGDLKSSARMAVPAEPSHPPHSHPSEYRTLPSLALSGAMGPMNENLHSRMGKPVPTSPSTESSGLNSSHTGNPIVDPGSVPYARPSPWNPCASTDYDYRASVSPALPPSVSAPVQGMNNHAAQMHSGYDMYQIHQPQQQSYVPTNMNHNGMPSMHHQEYVPAHPDPMSPPDHNSGTPRILPPVQVPYNDGYMYQVDNFQTQTFTTPSPPIVGARTDTPSRALAPLHTLNRVHPYKREHQDDKALRRLHPNIISSSPPH